MEDIRFKDIRVLPTPLDLKNNADKTLSEIFRQLQSGSVLKGLVVGTTPKGEVIFHTVYGRFAAPNPLNLESGDTINIKLCLGDEVVTGSIVKINNKKFNLEESWKLELVRQSKGANDKTPSKSMDNSPVSVRNSSNVPKSITGKISYLNLSKIAKISPLARVLHNGTLPTNNKILISVNVVTSNKPSVAAFIVNGVVSGEANRSGQQLVKTEFGVITTQNTKMPIGQRLSLEVTSLNNKPLANSLMKNVSDFMFNVNKEWPSIKNIILSPVMQTALDAKMLSDNASSLQSVVLKDSRKTNISEVRVERRKVSRDIFPESSNIKLSPPSAKQAESQSMNSIIKSLGEYKKIKQLSTEFHNIKELLTSSIKENEAAEKLQTVMIPFYDGKQVKEYEVKLDRTRNHFLRFLLDVNLENNPMQIDGLIKFEDDSKTPRAFDLTIRSRHKLSPTLQKRIVDIYDLNQNMTGIRGNFVIENL